VISTCASCGILCKAFSHTTARFTQRAVRVSVITTSRESRPPHSTILVVGGGFEYTQQCQNKYTKECQNTPKNALKFSHPGRMRLHFQLPPRASVCLCKLTQLLSNMLWLDYIKIVILFCFPNELLKGRKFGRIQRLAVSKKSLIEHNRLPQVPISRIAPRHINLLLT
jgi:hypothetical protein